MNINLIYERIQMEVNAGIKVLTEKGEFISPQNLIALGIFAVIGLLFCFFGLKMVRLWGAVSGFAWGFSGGACLASYLQVSDNNTLLIGLISGIVFAVLGAWLYLAGIFLVVLAAGIMGSTYFLQPADWKTFLICAGIGLIIALTALKFAEPVMMLVTGALGGGILGQAIDVFIPGENKIIRILIIIVIATAGIIIQFLMESRRRKKLHLRKAEEIRNSTSAENEVDKARALIDNMDNEIQANKTPSDELTDNEDIRIINLDDDR